MSNVEAFNTPRFTPYLHLSDLIVYTHDNLFLNADLSSLSTEKIFNGQRFQIPDRADNVMRRVFVSLLDKNALRLVGDMFHRQQKIFEQRTAGINLSAPDELTGDHRVKAALAGMEMMVIGMEIISSVKSALHAQYPAVARLKLDQMSMIEKPTPAMLHDWLLSKVKRLRTRHYGSEWVEIKTDHNISNVITTNITKMNKIMGYEEKQQPASYDGILPFKPI